MVSAAGKLEWQSPLSIIRYPDPRLRATNARIQRFDAQLKRLADEMFEVMYNGYGTLCPDIWTLNALFYTLALCLWPFMTCCWCLNMTRRSLGQALKCCPTGQACAGLISKVCISYALVPRMASHLSCPTFFQCVRCLWTVLPWCLFHQIKRSAWDS